MSRPKNNSPIKVSLLPQWLTATVVFLVCAGAAAAPLPSALPQYVDEPHGRPVDEDLAAYSRRALETALVARQRYLDGAADQAGSRPSLSNLASADPVVLDWTMLAEPAASTLSIGGTNDEPSGSVLLTTNPGLGCPGFYVLRTHANDVSQAGRFGAELNLTGSGARTLQGGLNFGGRATASVRGFSAFNIANATNELQVVTLGISVGAPGRVLMERRSGGQVVATPIDGMVEAGEWEAVVTVPPGFYVVAYTPTTQNSTSYAISALTSYTNRPGGGFQGGVVVGGYHDPARASGAMQSTGFAGFCIARDFNVTARVLSRPSYGSSGSTGMAFSISRGDGTVFLDSRLGNETFAFQPQDPLAHMQWHLRSTGAPIAQGLPAPAPGADLNLYPLWQNCPLSGCQGQGVVVAVVDDALEIGHPDLVGNVATNIPHRDVLQPGSATAQDPSPQQADDGHGTAVAGLIAARDNNIGGLGVASRATLVGINLLQANSSVNDAEAMIHAGNVVAVSNNSWGAPDGSGSLNPSDQTWRQAIELGISQGLGGRGIAYVWAGGNGHNPAEDGYFSDYSGIDGQANFHGVLAIAAVNADDRRSSYSEKGPNLLVSGFGGEFCGQEALTMTTTDLSAEGWGYNHAEADEADSDFPDRRFTRCFNGTSSAAPTVAGVVALIREANPGLSWRDVRWILAHNARKNDPGSDTWLTNGAGLTHNREYGFGVADAAASVQAAREMTSFLPTYRSVTTGSGSSPAIPGGSEVNATVQFASNSINRAEFVTAHVQIQGGSESFDAGDLALTLTSPAGVTALLTPKRRCTEPDPETEEPQWVFCEENLEFSFGAVQFLGENPNGTWTLGIDATSSPAPATLSNWSLTIHGHQGN